MSPGSSGGPVLGRNGRVIGIVQSQYKEGQNLNFAVLATHLSILISGKTDVAANVYRVPDSNEPPPPAEWVAVAGSETNVYLMNTRKSPTKTLKATILAPDKVIPRLDSEEGRASYKGDVDLLASEIGNMQLALSYSFQIEMVEYNCTQRATRILYRVFYDKVGKEFHKTAVPEDWSYPVPSTISYTMLRSVCGFTSRSRRTQ